MIVGALYSDEPIDQRAVKYREERLRTAFVLSKIADLMTADVIGWQIRCDDTAPIVDCGRFLINNSRLPEIERFGLC